MPVQWKRHSNADQSPASWSDHAQLRYPNRSFRNPWQDHHYFHDLPDPSEADADPTISVGGILPSIGGNIRVGQSETFVTEACEYTNSF